jgi:hypothetical protein
MPQADLTDELISAATAKADTRVGMSTPRCYDCPDRLEDALARSTLKGRCTFGWIVTRGSRESWHVWLETATGLGKLLPEADARADGFYGCFTLNNDVTQHSNMAASCCTTMWHSSPRDSYAYYQIRGESIDNKLSLKSNH